MRDVLRTAMLLVTAAALSGPAEAESYGNHDDTGASAQTLVAAPPAFLDACRRYAWLCETSDREGPVLAGPEALELARGINLRVNFAVAEITDAEHYGVPDLWTLPRHGMGDCEDFVLEKYRRLREAGVPAAALAVAIGLDRRGENHAVLILRTTEGDWVLDNLSNRVKRWSDTGYTFLAVQRRDDPQHWEVVYGRSRDSLRLASLN